MMGRENGYNRDRRSPKPQNENVSKSMSGNKGVNTKPELLLRRALWTRGVRGYRINYKEIPGKPDVVFTQKRVAVFVNGCFWHRCPKCNYPLPKNNNEYWARKFQKNQQRDNAKIQQLKDLGWTTFVIWECDLKAKLNNIAELLISLLYAPAPTQFNLF